MIGVNSKGIDWISKEIEMATDFKTPLLFLTGIIVGIKLLIPFVFFRIVTSESPKE